MSFGKARHLRRLFRDDGRPIIVVPIDDSLISGPEGWLGRPAELFRTLIGTGAVDAILGFPGTFNRWADAVPPSTSLIVNLTASTIRGQHTRKIQSSTVNDALRVGADLAAVHVNLGSKHEANMLAVLGRVASECDAVGLPLVAIMYPRGERENGDDDNYEVLRDSDEEGYARLVRHVVRVGIDLGADIIKAPFTGSIESFRTVIEAAEPVPVLVAGGPLQAAKQSLLIAQQAIQAGAAGVSFGRNVYARDDPGSFIESLASVVRGGADPDDA